MGAACSSSGGKNRRTAPAEYVLEGQPAAPPTTTFPSATPAVATAPAAASSSSAAAHAASTPIVDAIRAGDAAAVARILDREPSVAQQHGLLHIAAELGEADIVDMLLAGGADMSAVDDDGQTPLHNAVANGRHTAVEKLTARQPCQELRITDNYKMLPLHLACEDGDPLLIALLLARGACGTPATPTRPKPPSASASDAQLSTTSEGDEPPSPGASSPMSTRRKQLLAMQKAHGGSAIFIARNHEHHEAVELLQRAASGESIPMPDLSELSKKQSAPAG